jgi:hypothetical protein
MSKKNKRQLSRALASFTPKVAEFNPDYSTIKRDLRRIGILWGSFILALVILAIFQSQLLARFLK